MTMRESLHDLVESIPERDLATVERMLRGLKLPAEGREASAPSRPTREQRQQAARRLRAMMKGRVSTEAYLREKHEEVERENARQQQLQEAMRR